MANNIKIDIAQLGLSWAQGATLRIAVDPGFVTNASGQPLPAPGNTNVTTFTTPVSNPVLASTTPPNGELNSFVNKFLSINLDRGLASALTGNIYLYDSTDTLLATYDVTTDVVFDGGSIKIDIDPLLDPSSSYYVTTDINIAEDADGYPYAGIPTNASFAFTTDANYIDYFVITTDRPAATDEWARVDYDLSENSFPLPVGLGFTAISGPATLITMKVYLNGKPATYDLPTPPVGVTVSETTGTYTIEYSTFAHWEYIRDNSVINLDILNDLNFTFAVDHIYRNMNDPEFYITDGFDVTAEILTDYGVSLAFNNPNATTSFGYALDISEEYMAVCSDGTPDIVDVYTLVDGQRSYLRSVSQVDIRGVFIRDGNLLVATGQQDGTSGKYGVAYLYNLATGSFISSFANQYTDFRGDFEIFGNYVVLSGITSITNPNIQGRVIVFNLADATVAWEHAGTSTLRVGASSRLNGTYYAFTETDLPAYSTTRIKIYNLATGTLFRTLTESVPGAAPAFAMSTNNLYFPTTDTAGQYYVIADGTKTARTVNGLFRGINDQYILSRNSTSGGNIFLYTASTGTQAFTFANPNAYSTNSNDNYGDNIKLSQSFMVVSATGEDDIDLTNPGKVYFYDRMLSNQNAITNYQISPSTSFFNPGTAVTFTVNTINVPDATTLYWSIEDVTGGFVAADLAGDSFTGSFAITTNTGSVVITSDSGISLADKTFRLAVRTGSISGPIVEKSTIITLAYDNVEVLTPVSGNGASLTIPGTWEEDDYAFMFEVSNAFTAAPATPAGWTRLDPGTGGGGFQTNVYYKKLVTADISTSVGVQTNTGNFPRKILMGFRTPKGVATLSLSTPTVEYTAGAPSDQTIVGAGQTQPTVLLAMHANQATSIGTLGWTVGSPTTVSQAASTASAGNLVVKYLKYDQGTTPANTVISQTDTGAGQAMLGVRIKFNVT